MQFGEDSARQRLEGMVEDEEIVATLKQMRDEAEETEHRCVELTDSRDGKKTAILEKAQETSGRYRDEGVGRFEVYDREGLPCSRCGHRIRRIIQGGRSTYFCPHCQRR